MGLLLAVVAMTVGALLALLWPVVRPRGPGSGQAPDVAIYKDQLAELDRDVERGLVRPEEAAAARLEVERRLLRAAGTDEGRGSASGEATPRGRAAVLASAVLVPMLALGLYAGLGRPELAGIARPPPVAAAAPAGAPQASAQPGQPQLSVPEMVARLEKRLEADPADLEGWLMLGRSKGVLGDMPAAVAAHRKALELGPDDPRVLAGLGEALVGAAGGVVTPEAKGLLERLIQAGATDPRARYYLALAAAQSGDNGKAISLWRELLAAAPADAPWRAQVEESVRAAAGELGLDPATAVPPPAPKVAAAPAASAPVATAAVGPPAASAPAPGPTPADVAAAGQMSDAERSEFIRGMVGRLEERLAADGGDVEGWRRLAQSRLVLGEQDKAREAYERGLALHPADAGLLKAYAALLLAPSPQPDGLPVVGDRAAELYARAAQAAPDDPEAQWFLGIRALQQGRQDEARDRWTRLLARIDPADPNYAAVKERLESLGG